MLVVVTAGWGGDDGGDRVGGDAGGRVDFGSGGADGCVGGCLEGGEEW